MSLRLSMITLLMLMLSALLGVQTAHGLKTWSSLAAKFPGQPGQPANYLGTGTFRLADWAIPPSSDNSDPRFTYDENFILRFNRDGSHRLEFLVSYLDRTELGSILYPATLFAPYLEASVVLDERNNIDRDFGCLFNLNSLPDIFVPAFWEIVTAAGTPIEFVEERDYRGVACDYFEGVIPADPSTGAPATTVGWYNRKTSDTAIEKYAPLEYFLGPASFEQTVSYPDPTFPKVEDHLTRGLTDRLPATWLCIDVTTPFLESGSLPSARSVNTRSEGEIAAQQVRSFIEGLTQ